MNYMHGLPVLPRSKIHVNDFFTNFTPFPFHPLEIGNTCPDPNTPFDCLNRFCY